MKTVRAILLAVCIATLATLFVACSQFFDNKPEGPSLKVTLQLPDGVDVDHTLQTIQMRLTDVQGSRNVGKPQPVKGSNCYCFEIWNVKDTSLILNLMTAPGEFGMWIVEKSDMHEYTVDEIDSCLGGHRLRPLLTAGDGTFGEWAFASPEDADTINALLAEAESKDCYLTDFIQLYWSKEMDMIHALEVNYNDGSPLISNRDIAKVEKDSDHSFMITFTDNGRKKFREITYDNIGRQLAIVIDGKVYSAPNIASEIPSGRSQVTGCITKEEVVNLCAILDHPSIAKGIQVVSLEIPNNESIN